MSYEGYEKLLKEKRVWYKTLKLCYCPALKTDVIFNSKGFHHLIYDGSCKARTNEERIRRLGLLFFVVMVISNAEHISSHSLEGDTEYWVFKDRICEDMTNIVVVLRKIGSGNIHFYSVWDE